MTVDFHVHSVASDGTCTPTELVAMAVGSGCSVMALTDHDNIDGQAEFTTAAQTAGIRAVTGLELSIDPGVGFDKFHLLALGVNPYDVGLGVFLRHVLEGRNARNKRIAANFRRLGIELEDSVRAYAHGDVLARPHYARWLVDHGYAEDKNDAFVRYLLPDSPASTRCYEERWHPSQEETFQTVHAAGGLCVMAHPKFWRNDWKREGVDFADAERELARLREAGLDGLEAIYQANTVDENVAFSQMADRLGLVKTAGSDFHGANKPEVPFGMSVGESFLRSLLERLPTEL